VPERSEVILMKKKGGRILERGWRYKEKSNVEKVIFRGEKEERVVSRTGCHKKDHREGGTVPEINDADPVGEGKRETKYLPLRQRKREKGARQGRWQAHYL